MRGLSDDPARAGLSGLFIERSSFQCFVQGVFGTIPGDSANGPACAVIKFLSSFTRYLGQAGIDYREPLPKALASLKCK